MDAASAMKPRRDVFITGHAIPSSSLESMHPKPCDHPMESSRPPAVKCTEINGSVMAAVGYHKKHVMTDHDCGMQPPQRVRSNTVPTALLRRLRNGAAAEPTSVHATADGLVHCRGPNARTASLESLESRERHDARTTRHDEIVMSHMKHKQQDECLLRHRRSTDSVLSYPRPLSPALPSEELSAVTLLDQCMDAADDEFYTVYRDPLPKGSSVFEKVLHEFEPDCSATNGPVHLLHMMCKSENGNEADDKTPLSVSPTSPRENRHVHWVDPAPCQNVA